MIKYMLLRIVLVSVLMLGILFMYVPYTASASTTVIDLGDYDETIDIINAIHAALSTGDVTVMGTYNPAAPNTNEYLTLDIPSGRTVYWNAEFTLTTSYMTGINIYCWPGSANFIVGTGADIDVTSSIGTGLYIDSLNVTINGGAIKATGNINGINNMQNGILNVNGGTVGAESTGVGSNSSGIHNAGTINLSGGSITVSGREGINNSSSGTINVNSGGTVDATGSGGNDGYGINNSGSLNINGGTVEAKSTGTVSNSFGINNKQTATIDIKNAVTVNAEGNSSGIRNHDGGTINIDGGTIYAIATGTVEISGTAVSSGFSIFNLGGSLSVNGGTVNATGFVTGVNSSGIYNGNGLLNVNGGTITAIGDRAGIYNIAGYITIDGGNVNATATSISSNSDGIYNDGPLAISGGTVNATGVGTGIYNTLATLAITGGTITANATTGQAFNFDPLPDVIQGNFQWELGSDASNITSSGFHPTPNPFVYANEEWVKIHFINSGGGGSTGGGSTGGRAVRAGSEPLRALLPRARRSAHGLLSPAHR